MPERPNRAEPLPSGDRTPPYEACCSPSEFKHVNEYLELFNGNEGGKCSPSGAFPCGISQAKTRARCGPGLPAFTRSSVMVSFSALYPTSRWHFYTDKELAFAHVYPMTESSPVQCRDCMKNDFDGMAHSSIRSALGNGMPLPIQTAWFAFVLSNCVCK